MDELEDVSARFLLRNVLRTDTAKSPVKQRALSSQVQSTSARRISRTKTGRKSVGDGSPLVTLQHKLKQRLREAASCSPASSSNQKAKASAQKSSLAPLEGQGATPRVLRSTKNAASARKSSLALLMGDDGGLSPRVLLRRIIHTEAETSMVSSQPGAEKVKSMASGSHCTEEVRPFSTESTLCYDNQGDSVDQTELDLSDMEMKQSVRKGLSRKRVPLPISVSGFENQLECLTEEQPKPYVLQDVTDLMSVTLKTPTFHASAPRGQLQRKPIDRELVSEELFEEAVNDRLQKCPEPSRILADRTGKDSFWQGHTLGLSDVTVPDLTADIIMSNTTLYTPSISQPGTVDGAEELQTHHSQKEDSLAVTKQTVTGEVSRALPEEMVPETQEEGEFMTRTASQTGHMDDLDPMNVDPVPEYTIQNGCQDVEEQHLDKPTPLANDTILEPRGVVGDEVQSVTSQRRDVTLTIESEEITEHGSEVVQTTGVLPEDKEMEILEHVARRSAYSSEHGPGVKPVVSSQTIDRRRTFEIGRAEDHDQKMETETGSQSDGGLALASLPSERGSEEEEQDKEEFQDHEEMELETGSQSDGALAPESALTPMPSQRDSEEEEEEEEEQQDEEEEEGEEEFQDQEKIESETGSQSDGALVPESALTSMPSQRDSEEEEQQDEEEEEEEEEQQDEEEVEEGEEEFQDHEEMESETGRQSDGALAPESALTPMPSQRDSEEEEEEEEEGEEEEFQELAQKTPAFVRQRKEAPTVLPSPAVQRETLSPAAVQPSKSRPRQDRKRPANAAPRGFALPKSHVMGIFKHFAKTKVSNDVYPVISEILQKYFERAAKDLESYASHAQRKTIERKDVELLMRRQGFITDSSQVNVLIEKFLPFQYRKLLIPVATSGNKLIPKGKC